MRFIDSYFYRPNFLQKCLAIALLPISFLYFLAATIRRKSAKFYDFGIPIISVGNLIAGGSGKTPFLQEIALFLSESRGESTQKSPRESSESHPESKNRPHIAIVSRGYKRKSKGMLTVSLEGAIQTTQENAGDEAFMLAKNLNFATIIVAKDRRRGILRAIELGAKVILLDDGFRFNFKKLNIVLSPQLRPFFRLPLPSGIYRENPFWRPKNGNFCGNNCGESVESRGDFCNDLSLEEGRDYQRKVSVESPTARMLLCTAIANPSRLEAFLPPNVVDKIALPDHARFDLAFLRRRFEETSATSLLVTQKDAVKLEDCGLPLSILRLKIHINEEVKRRILGYAREVCGLENTNFGGINGLWA